VRFGWGDKMPASSRAAARVIWDLLAQSRLFLLSDCPAAVAVLHFLERLLICLALHRFVLLSTQRIPPVRSISHSSINEYWLHGKQRFVLQ
jgi:hypothetical protein